MDLYFQVIGLVTVIFVYILYLLVRRLYFHPLACFPGPKLAAATKWYEFYYDILKRPGGQFMYEINRMHEVYGPIVRINPEELHVRDSDWIEALYTGPSSASLSSHTEIGFADFSKGIRDKYPPAAHMTGTPRGIFGTIDHEIHRKRRAAVSPFFSKSNVSSAESMIYDKTNAFCKEMRRNLACGGAVELRKLYLAITTDTLSAHCFENSLDLLKDDRRANDWKKTIRAVAVLTPLIKQFTWIISIALRLPLGLLQMLVPDLARIVALRRDLRKQAKAAIQEVATQEAKSITMEQPILPLSGKKAKDTNIFHSILRSKILSSIEKEEDRIAQEAFVVLVAGGETTAQVLTTATFHLLANKDTALLRLKDELNGIMLDPEIQVSLKILEQLPWLTAVIKESLRITALVTSRLPLVAPYETLNYGGWSIPPGTPVSMTLRDVLLDPSIFTEPMKFLPERWLVNSPDLERVAQGYIPFGRGSRMCVGLNFALAELHIIIAYLFRRFDLELYNTNRERDIDVARDCFIGEPSTASLGVRVRDKVTSVQSV